MEEGKENSQFWVAMDSKDRTVYHSLSSGKLSTSCDLTDPLSAGVDFRCQFLTSKVDPHSE